MMRVTTMVLASLSLASSAMGQTVFITELMVGNDRAYCDSLGDDPDWIELHNPTPTSADISGWALTDQPRVKPQRWKVPANTVIAPGGYLVIFFLNKNPAHRERTDSKDLHAGFRLDMSGEEIALVNASQVEVHRIRFGKQSRNVSIGTSDRYDPAAPLKWPTPGLPNDAPAPQNRCP